MTKTKTNIREFGHCRNGSRSYIDFQIDGEIYRYFADQVYVDIALAKADFKPGEALAFIKRNCDLCAKK